MRLRNVVGLLWLLNLGCGSDDSAGSGGDEDDGAGGSAMAGAGTGGATTGGTAGAGAGAGGTVQGGSAGAGAGGAAGSAGGGGGGTGGGGGSAHQFSIRFDYRFDTVGYFSDPAKRAALEAAAALWSRSIRDDFEPVPAGTAIRCMNPENRDEYVWADSLEQEIDDLLVFVGTSEAITGLGRGGPSGVAETADPALAEALATRRDGPDFEPWAGSITFKASSNFFFDPTPETADDIPFEAYDFISTAAHELGHVLGFGNSAAFDSFVSGTTFIGPVAVSVYGGPVPLDADVSHFVNHNLFEGQETLMDTGQYNGARLLPTRIDLAVIDDLGFEVE